MAGAQPQPTLYIALPVTKRFQCPVCLSLGISTIRKREGLKRHLTQDHGPGWELSYVCCDTEFSCRQQKYAFKTAKAHFAEAHRGTPFEVQDEEELGVAETSYNSLQEKIIRIATPARPAGPENPSPSGSEGEGSDHELPPPLARARSAAARARHAQHHQAEDPVLTPVRTPLVAAFRLSPGAPPEPAQIPQTVSPNTSSPSSPVPPPRTRPPGQPPSPDPPSPGPDPAAGLDDQLPDELSAWQRSWLRRFPPDIAWADFLVALAEITESLAPPSRPAQRQRQHGPDTRRDRRDVREAARIQRLYRKNASRAMRDVLKEDSPLCTIPENIISNYFQETYAPRDGCEGEPPANCAIPRAPAPPNLLDRVAPEEVARLLKKTSNTAPGPDGVKYAVWRRRDHSGHVLAAIFNICVSARRFPPEWKKSTTILIHKKGDTRDITNWRPIALSGTAGKLLCSLLADRLSTWASNHHLISEAQKGFTPSEGCLEHNFILQELLDDARRRGGELCVAWLDLANAFGGVPHVALTTALLNAGLTEDQLQFVGDLYDDSTTSIRHSTGSTEPIAFGAGVRQGCPLSPILFNLAMESLIRPLVALEEQHGALLHGTRVSVLAYADDLALVARSEASMRTLMETVTQAADWVGLRFKPAKCATLHVARRKTLPTAFKIYGTQLQVLRDGDSYVHLGVPTGMKADQTPVASIARIEVEAATIFDSLLAPWQKLHALRTFTIPQLEFNFKTARIQKTALRSLDNIIKKGCKKVFNLPARASAELVYLPPSSGGAGLIPLADLSDLAAVNHAFRLLTSPDNRSLMWPWRALLCLLAKDLQGMQAWSFWLTT